MNGYSHHSEVAVGTLPARWGIPPWFVTVAEVLPRALDRTVGYCGGERFVPFRCEPRGQEVVWADGHS